MATNEKASDAVRITRIIAPTVLIIVLAVIFKSEFGSMVNRGCFELSIEQAGIGLADQSMCTKDDFERTADSLISIGARQAEEKAKKAFDAYEQQVENALKSNQELVAQFKTVQEEYLQYQGRKTEYAALLDDAVRRSSTREARLIATKLNTQYAELFNVERTEPLVAQQMLIDQKAVEQVNNNIRTDYIKQSRINVESVQRSIKVERRK